jgi:hypothetical protein
MKLRLKAIIPNADFRKSEATLHDEFLRSRNYPGDLRKGECFLFLSKSGNQLLWFFTQVSQIKGFKDAEIEVYDSRKWRVTGGTWHPFMLANYASEVGIELVGIKRFEEIIDERRRRR